MLVLLISLDDHIFLIDWNAMLARSIRLSMLALHQAQVNI